MNETTKILIRGGGVLLGGVVLFFVARKVAKTIKDKNEKKRDDKREEDSKGMGSEQAEDEQTKAQSYNPASDLASFEDYVHGANGLNSYEYEVDALFNKLSNAELCKLDKAHRSKHNQSMWKHLDEEWDICGTFGGNDCYKESKRRLRNAGCG